MRHWHIYQIFSHLLSQLLYIDVLSLWLLFVTRFPLTWRVRNSKARMLEESLWMFSSVREKWHVIHAVQGIFCCVETFLSWVWDSRGEYLKTWSDKIWNIHFLRVEQLFNGEGELRGQPANAGSPGKWPLQWCVCVCGTVACLIITCQLSLGCFLPWYLNCSAVFCLVFILL